MTLISRIAGENQEVMRLFALWVRERGNLTLGEVYESLGHGTG